MNDRLLTREEMETILTFKLPKEVSSGFVITRQTLRNFNKAQDAKALKEVGEWLEKKVVGFLAGDLSKLIIATEAIETLKHGEMPDMGNRED